MSVESSAHFHRAARGVLRWTMTYTRGLDARIAAGRQDEIASDLHEHAVWAGEVGVTPRRLAWSIRLRALRGAPADLIWRSAVLRRADPGVRLALRAHAALLAVVLAVGVLDVAVGGFVLFRLVRALMIGDVRSIPGPALGAIVLGLIALLALMAMVGERLRGWATLALAVPTGLILAETGRALYFLSASAVVLVNRLPWWEAATYAIGAALALVCVTAALHWLRRPTDARTGRQATVLREGAPHA
ncbi:hypothetical protein EV187_1569 [Agromyces ramosus]|uniref:Uncharacterized protein n=1 Tax=Agromyces ramosus TaxID=33879 RepID=A0A4Q7MCA2_9MICO|nr:hypothetical protein [Agromyces ramosus]RZS65865.1 hypothetical protein EV187_1569 [Agromyces ramosus]